MDQQLALELLIWIRLDAGYDLSSERMYFKLGAYTQNNTGNKSDGDIITFYRLENTHDKN